MECRKSINTESERKVKKMNYISLMGRVVREPEIKYTNDNKCIARYSIAVSRKFKNKQGNYDTDFFNLVSFNSTALFIEKYLHKGVKILVEGELRNNNYEKDGKTVYSDQIIVNSVEFCESKNTNDTQTDNDGFNAVEGATEEQLPFV